MQGYCAASQEQWTLATSQSPPLWREKTKQSGTEFQLLLYAVNMTESYPFQVKVIEYEYLTDVKRTLTQRLFFSNYCILRHFNLNRKFNVLGYTADSVVDPPIFQFEML